MYLSSRREFVGRDGLAISISSLQRCLMELRPGPCAGQDKTNSPKNVLWIYCSFLDLMTSIMLKGTKFFRMTFRITHSFCKYCTEDT